MTKIPAPALIPIGELAVDVAPAIDVGMGPRGVRRVIPILGGTFTGERLNGHILPGFNDYQIVRHDGVLELQARYVIETSDKKLIFVENNGMREAAPDVMAAMMRGEPVDQSKVYFRAIPRFETAAPEYLWLTKRMFVSSGFRFPDGLRLRFFELT